MEKYKDIPEYKDYKVSNLGSVKSFKKEGGIDLKPGKAKNGYLTVCLSNENGRKTFTIHQLVAIAFLNHKPCGYELVVDHINEDKTDNRLDNLQLLSSRQNNIKSKDNKKKYSKYVGVTWRKNRNKWQASIYVNGKPIYLGNYVNEFDAHLAYQKALKKYGVS